MPKVGRFARFILRPRGRAAGDGAWRQRAAVALAALASVATSPARWRLTAPAPAAPPGPERGLLVTVEATGHPTVRATRGELERTLNPLVEGPQFGPGRREYYAPPGWQVSQVELEEPCTSGGMCSDCKAPRDAFVRVGRFEIVEAWTLDATSGPQSSSVEEVIAGRGYEVTVEATARPRVEAESTPPMGDVKAFVSGGEKPEPLAEGRSLYRYYVSWVWQDRGLGAPGALSFVVRASLEGFCRPGEAASGQCTPPEGASITNLTVRHR
jgi:hypothetical protein